MQGASALLGEVALLGLVAAVALGLLALFADQALLLFAIEALALQAVAVDAICRQVTTGDAGAAALLLLTLGSFALRFALQAQCALLIVAAAVDPLPFGLLPLRQVALPLLTLVGLLAHGTLPLFVATAGLLLFGLLSFGLLSLDLLSLDLLSFDLLPLRLHPLALLTDFVPLAQGALLLILATLRLLSLRLLTFGLLPLRLHALSLLASLGLLAHGALLLAIATFNLLTFGLLPLRLHALSLLASLGLLAHGALLIVVATLCLLLLGLLAFGLHALALLARGLLSLRLSACFGLLAALVDLVLVLFVLRGAITRVFARVRALGEAQRQREAECH